MNYLTTIRIHTSKAWLLCSFILFLFLGVSAQEEISFLFVGDVMQHDGQINAAYNKKTSTYEYEDGFKFVKPIINKYDWKIANLEVTLAGKPYKGYPQFSAPDDLAETLVNTGFNLILTANNHSCDRGDKGVVRTLDQLDKLGVRHTGTFRSKAERDSLYPLMIEENGMKVAVLNYTYGTNGLSVSKPLIINYIDSAVIRKDIARAKELNADYIICNMHWGKEYKLLPDSYEKKWEQFCYDEGVDMVIGGHPHVVQPIETKEINGENHLTVWSLGNFVSNMSVRYTRGGVMVGATIEKKESGIQLKSAENWLVWVHKKQEGALKQYYILPAFDYNTYRPDFLSTEDLALMKRFFDDSRKLYGEHNSGCPEMFVNDDEAISKLYQNYLRGYYSVLVEGQNDDLLHHSAMGDYLHETVDKNGNVYLLSGIFETQQEAIANANFVQDCGLTAEPKVVWVNINGIEEIE